VWFDPRIHRFWGVHHADSEGRPDRRLEDKLHCYGCGPMSRFKYTMTTDRRDRLQHRGCCAHNSEVFWATHQYLEESANRLVFLPPPTQRDLETTYRRVKWFNGLVNRGVLGAEGPPAAFLSKQLVALLAVCCRGPVRWGSTRRWSGMRLGMGMRSRGFREMNSCDELLRPTPLVGRRG